MAEIDIQYRQGAESGRFMVQKCPNCGRLRFPPVSICPNCLTPSNEWVAVSGRGTIWSWIRMHRQYFKNGFREVPYSVVMVELDEGLRLISGIVGPDDDLHCGQAVEAVFSDEGNGVLPWFRVIETAKG